MATNPSILLQGQVPQLDLINPLLGGLQAREYMQNAPMRNQLLEQNIASNAQNMQVNNQAMQMNQQRMGMNDASMQNDARAAAAEKARIINRHVESLKAIPVEQRAVAHARFEQQLEQMFPGSINDQQDDLSDAGLAHLQASVAPLMGYGIKPAATSSEYAAFRQKISGLSDADQKKAVRVDLGLDPRAVTNAAGTAAGAGTVDELADAEEDIAEGKAKGGARGKGSETRSQDLINRGVAAAESTATIRRAIELLDTVETGGIDAASLAIKQYFGVEGADEGELSNSLGKAVLTQLRETFGAAFTQEEGQRLARIEANFGRNTETNKRLLHQALAIAERTANRGIKAAEERDDAAAIDDIQSLLDFRLDSETGGSPPGPSPAGSEFVTKAGLRVLVK